MSNDSRLNPIYKGDDDDWETADLELARPKKSSFTPSPQVPTLRPSAPAFVPKPTVIAPTRGILSRPVNGGTRNASKEKNKATEPRGVEEDEWFGSRRPSSNRQIWDSANASSSTPPAIITPTTSDPAQSTTLPPTRTLQILRRPTSDQPNKRSTGGQAGSKTLSEREEEYRLARERIFGATPAVEGVEAENGSGKANGRKSRNGSGSGSKRNSPSHTPVHGGEIGGLEDDLGRFLITPTQIRRSPLPRGGGGQIQGQSGVVRQPKGPGEGSGFGMGGTGGMGGWNGSGSGY